MKRNFNYFLAILMVISLFVIASERLILAELWVQKADMPTKRWDHASCVVNGIIYAFGGGPGPLQSVEAYEPATNTWTKKANMLIGKTGPSVCELNGIIYMIGGWGNSQALSTVEAYDPSTDTWTKKADMPTRRQYLTVNVVNGIIYAIGGWPPTGAVEAYDPATNTWVKKSDMPTARGALSSGVVNGLIYAVGGSIDTTNGSPLNAFEVYDPSMDKWTKSVLPFSVAWSAACVLDNMLYLVEGYSIPKRIMAYDPVTNIWRSVTDTYTTRWEHTANVVNGKIYVIGGYLSSSTTNQPTGSVQEYDPLRAPRRPVLSIDANALAILWGKIKVSD